jgi:hypothetical protein
MQPVNNSLIRNQAHPSQQRIPANRDTSAYSVKSSSSTNAFSLPEDVVNLSTGNPSNLESMVKKISSVPVTRVERKALQDSFSVYA